MSRISPGGLFALSSLGAYCTFGWHCRRSGIHDAATANPKWQALLSIQMSSRCMCRPAGTHAHLASEGGSG